MLAGYGANPEGPIARLARSNLNYPCGAPKDLWFCRALGQMRAGTRYGGREAMS